MERLPTLDNPTRVGHRAGVSRCGVVAREQSADQHALAAIPPITTIVGMPLRYNGLVRRK